jgi:hypothetical protein
VVADEALQTDTATMTIEVVDVINIAPEILSLTPSKKYTSPGGTLTLSADVIDLNNDVISYSWSASTGEIIGSDEITDWLAPPVEGISTILLTVTDGHGGVTTKSIQLLVLDPNLHKEGNLIAWYPFQDNAQDVSGHQLHGTVSGAKLTADSLGHASAAYFFDGINDHIRVTNQPILNFTKGATISLFAQPQLIGDKERFIISHGSWQNRWKLSITPDRKVRWTLKNASGQVKDLDATTVLVENKFYHIAASYDGRFMMIYINGQLESFAPFSGDINPSPVDLEIGQILPDDPMYSFRGVLDEIKIFDYALRPDSVAAESGIVMTGTEDPSLDKPLLLHLYPNPANRSITLDLSDVPDNINTATWLISISASDGHVVWKGAFGDMHRKMIDISALNPGLHILRLDGGGNVRILKFIIEK